MTFGAGTGAAGASAGTICPDCSTPATGNFCSSCGADLRDGSGLIGTVASSAKTSVPGTYLRLLRSPVRATVALAEDPSYRQHISFLLSGLALFCVIMVPFFMQTADPTGAMAQYSESMQTLMKVLSQTGVYFGAIVTFLLGYLAFRSFAGAPRTWKQYLKLYCLAYGFIMPPYALYDYVARGVFNTTGLSSFAQTEPTPEQMMSAPFAVSIVVSILIWAYFIAIHRRFWNMALWKAGALYTAVALVANQAGYYAMYQFGYWVTYYLIQAGVVTV